MCYQFAGSISTLYSKFSTAIGFSLGLSSFQLTDLSRKALFKSSPFAGDLVLLRRPFLLFAAYECIADDPFPIRHGAFTRMLSRVPCHVADVVLM